VNIDVCKGCCASVDCNGEESMERVSILLWD
jgi:hypothetical protein